MIFKTSSHKRLNARLRLQAKARKIGTDVEYAKQIEKLYDSYRRSRERANYVCAAKD